jgi:hypothetical protein
MTDKQKIQEAKDFLNEINSDWRTEEEANQLRDELAAELAAYEIKPKEVTPEIEAVRRALENAKNNPKSIGHIRDFSLKSYITNDKQAKDLFTTYLQNKGYIVDSTEETYKSDVTASKNGESVLFELEISQMDFDKNNWPFPFVHFLGRKERYYKEEGDFHYVLISKNGKYALTAKASDIFKKENYTTKECNRDGVTGIDEFYSVNVNQVKFFKL